MKNKNITVYHDDQIDDIIDKINQLLIEHELEISDISEDGQDFCVYELISK